ncbi:ComEA family DNA-binding protein [Gordonia sp. LSe1-13]|uniref:ComEA family DNA-binding protein n=1 Tax=Gordonia sesuvii TaxID=3116777 RepID=A0ABU7MK99_9ACTN|nr:ComEA family DNA-binding protein [Gordonia sp. LSe1-13]
MSTSASRRRSGLDRLDTRPPARTVAGDETVAGESDSGHVPADRGVTEDSPWGVTAVPTWLEPVGARDRAATRMTVGDHFGLPDEDDEDEPPRRRLLVAPPAAIALILVGVAACAVAGFSLLRGGGAESATPVAFPATAGPTSAVDTTAEAPAPSEELVVSVVGLVHKPGLVRLSGAARVADAIARAGGARKGADMLSLNLAQRLNDGDQILVGYAGDGGRMAIRSAVVGAGGAASVPSSGAGAPSGGTGSNGAQSNGTQSAKVDLNTATEAQLDELPGVGPVTAQAIIAWREANGRFGSVEQLAEVDGIGPTRLSRLRDLVTV